MDREVVVECVEIFVNFVVALSRLICAGEKRCSLLRTECCYAPLTSSFLSLLATTALPSASALQARNLSQVGLLRLLHSIHSYANIASFKGNRDRDAHKQVSTLTHFWVVPKRLPFIRGRSFAVQGLPFVCM